MRHITPQANKTTYAFYIFTQAPMKNLHELFIDEMKDMYYAEKVIVKELPGMAKKASSPDLKKAFEDHLEETEEHVTRLEKAFKSLDVTARGKKCEAIDGIIKEAKEMLKEAETDNVRDALLIVSAQKVEHYEICSYGTLCAMAELMKHTEALNLFKETLNEEE